MKIKFFIGRFLPMCCISLMMNGVMATQLVSESTIFIQGQERRYFHLHDPEYTDNGPAILLMSGSGCDDFGARLSSYFKESLSPVDVYFLEKPDITKGSDGLNCSKKYIEADQLDRRVADNLEFLEAESTLKKSEKHSIAALGFSEGGPVALQIASKSGKIGWLACGCR